MAERIRADGLILAGGALERERFPGLSDQVRCKAEIPVLGHPLVHWSAAALRGVPGMERIVIIGDPALAGPDLEALQAAVIPETGSIEGNLKAGLDALPNAGPVLITSADLPLATPAALEDLLVRIADADIVFPFVTRSVIEARFPDRKWIYARTPDGDLTGASAGVAQREALLASWPWVERILNARRASPLRLAAMLGIPFALRLLLGRLGVRDAEKRMSELLHLRARGHASPYAELALDVDKATDLPLIEEEIRRRTES